MFPHTITIFNIVNGEYRRQIVDNVFYYTDKSIVDENKGEKIDISYNIIFSAEALKKYLSPDEYSSKNNYVDYYTLKLNDIIVLGECSKISDLKDLQKSSKEYFLIKRIADNRYGGEILQNIEVSI